jgi:uncharacterized protein YaiI (UPF0178 family)
MQIIVDADACPVKDEIVRVAARHDVSVLFVACYAHELDGYNVLRVDKEPQAADMAIVNKIQPWDVVVTGDYGLAAMALGKRARVLSFRGQRFTESNIDQLLAQRHLHQRVRRGGGRMRGPKAFSRDDRERFEAALQSLLAADAADRD